MTTKEEERLKKNAYQREYRKKNREKVNELEKTWRKNNPGRRSAWDARYKNNKLFGGSRQLALERDNWQCQECGMNQEQHFVLFGRGLTVHHKDGDGLKCDNPNNDLDNLQTLCLRCHGSKDGSRGGGRPPAKRGEQ